MNLELVAEAMAGQARQLRHFSRALKETRCPIESPDFSDETTISSVQGWFGEIRNLVSLACGVSHDFAEEIKSMVYSNFDLAGKETELAHHVWNAIYTVDESSMRLEEAISHFSQLARAHSNDNQPMTEKRIEAFQKAFNWALDAFCKTVNSIDTTAYLAEEYLQTARDVIEYMNMSEVYGPIWSMGSTGLDDDLSSIIQ